MVYHLLDQSMSPNIDFKTEVNIYRSPHSSKLVKSSTCLYTLFARLYPTTNLLSGRFVKRGIYTTGRGDRGSRRGGCFNVLGNGRGRGGRCGQLRVVHVQGGCRGVSSTYEFFIDISEVSRYFEDAEWAVISKKTIKMITEDPERTKLLDTKNIWTTSSGSAEKDN